MKANLLLQEIEDIDILKSKGIKIDKNIILNPDLISKLENKKIFYSIYKYKASNIRKRNKFFFKKYFQFINDLDKSNHKILNINLASIIGHLLRLDFFSFLNEADLITDICKKYRKHKIYIVKKNYNINDPLRLILEKKYYKNLQIIYENKNFQKTELDKYKSIFLDLANFKLLPIFKFCFKKNLKSIKILRLKYIVSIFHSLTSFKFCKEINLFFENSIYLNKILKKKNIFFIENFITFKSLIFFRYKKKNIDFFRKNFFNTKKKFTYKKLPVDKYLIDILIHTFYNNQFGFFYILNRFRLLNKITKIKSATSLYNQWPLQDLIFKTMNNNITKFYTSIHGGAHSLFKNYPIMDQNWDYSYKNTYILNNKKNLEFINYQKKIDRFIIHKNNINFTNYKNDYSNFNPKKNNYSFCYIANSIGKNYNSENKFIDQIDDINYYIFLKNLAIFFKQKKNSNFSIKMKNNCFDNIKLELKKISKVYNYKIQINKIINNYDYFIISHFSTPIKELLQRGKRIILLLSNKEIYFIKKNYNLLNKCLIIVRSEKELYKILNKLSSGKLKNKKIDRFYVNKFLKIYINEFEF